MIQIILAITIFILYNTRILYKFGIPESLSKSYYLFKKDGYVFYLTLILVSILLLPELLVITPPIFIWMPYIFVGNLLLVAASPRFIYNPDSYEDDIHKVSAIASAISAILWTILITKFWWIILISFSIIGLIIYLFNKTKYVYIAEMVVFASVFTALLIK